MSRSNKASPHWAGFVCIPQHGKICGRSLAEAAITISKGLYMVTRAVEDYLKAIYKLQQDGTPASTNAIADSMGLQAASVTAMLKHLSEQGLADYTRYQGVSLTDKGKEAALRVIRRHR